MMYRTILFFFLFYILLSIFYIPQANASEISLGIYPPLIQLESTSSSTIDSPITLSNLTDATLNLSVQLKPFTSSEKENGEIKYLPDARIKSTPYPHIFDKVQIRDNDTAVKTLTLGPRQSKNLTLHLDLDSNEQSIDYYFSIVFLSTPIEATPQEQNAITAHTSITAGIATNVLLSVNPQGDTNGSIEEFSSPSFVDHGPISFKVHLKNLSMHKIAPTGTISITNVFNQIIGKIDLLQSPILSQSSRFLTSQHSFSPPVALWPETFLLGPYDATLTVKLSSNGPVLSQTIRFFAFPLRLFLLLLVTTTIIVVIIKRVRKRRNT